MTGRFDRRTAVVTGGAQGIGAAIVRRLVAEGARVLIADRNPDRGEALATELGEAVAYANVDVTDPESVSAVPSLVSSAFGAGLDLLVCNAGIQTFHRGADLPVDDWDRVLDVNARGTLLAFQAAAHAMQSVTPGTAGAPAIVAISSIQGRLPGPFYPHYSASKAAVLSLVKSFAVELAPKGIRVNAVAPGIIATELWDRADRELSALTNEKPGTARSARIASVPLRRAGNPDDVAASVGFLLSDDASYITGECLHVCGGDVML